MKQEMNTGARKSKKQPTSARRGGSGEKQRARNGARNECRCKKSKE